MWAQACADKLAAKLDYDFIYCADLQDVLYGWLQLMLKYGDVWLALLVLHVFDCFRQICEHSAVCYDTWLWYTISFVLFGLSYQLALV